MSFEFPNISPSSSKRLCEEKPCPTKKKFPKIQEIDPDKKKKKKNQEDPVNVSIFTLERQSIDSKNLESVRKASKACLEDLYKSMVDGIVFQKNSDRAKTELLLNTQAFGKIEVLITTYSTNPYCLHIDIRGNEEIQRYVSLHKDSLEKRLHMTIPNIKVHIKNPSLRKIDRYKSHKKSLRIQKEVDMVESLKDY